MDDQYRHIVSIITITNEVKQLITHDNQKEIFPDKIAEEILKKHEKD